MDRRNSALPADLYRIHRCRYRSTQEQSHPGRFPLSHLPETIDARDVDAGGYHAHCVFGLRDVADISVAAADRWAADVGGQPADRACLQRRARWVRADDV